MAISIKEVKQKMDSTKKTGQIIKAMYMVSQSKVKRSEKTYHDYQDFLVKKENLLKTALAKAGDSYENKLIKDNHSGIVAYLLITSDTGLAGSYNANIFNYFMDESKDKNYVLGVIGKKGFGYAKNKNLPIVNDVPIFNRDDVLFVDIIPLAESLIKMYESGEIDKIDIIYNHYENSMTSTVVKKELLPFKIDSVEEKDGEVLFEYGLDITIDELLVSYVSSTIYGIILDSKTSEHSSRMNAMKTASDNVDEIVETLDVMYNRARQAEITSEISDIVAGAKAI